MPSSPVIRPITADDQQVWETLWKAYLAFYDTRLAQDVIDTAFARLLADDAHDFHGLLAEVDGKVCGLTHYVFHRSLWQISPVCYLQDLYADPSVRGMGIGYALIQGVYAKADAAGAPNVYWMTQDFNATARKLYDQCADLTPFIKYKRRGL